MVRNGPSTSAPALSTIDASATETCHRYGRKYRNSRFISRLSYALPRTSSSWADAIHTILNCSRKRNRAECLVSPIAPAPRFGARVSRQSGVPQIPAPAAYVNNAERLRVLSVLRLRQTSQRDLSLWRHLGGRGIREKPPAKCAGPRSACSSPNSHTAARSHLGAPAAR